MVSRPVEPAELFLAYLGEVAAKRPRSLSAKALHAASPMKAVSLSWPGETAPSIKEGKRLRVLLLSVPPDRLETRSIRYKALLDSLVRLRGLRRERATWWARSVRHGGNIMEEFTQVRPTAVFHEVVLFQTSISRQRSIQRL